ncbi:unnamed protein product [Peronospora belbahrii]|uniref:PX domain-containing protein n=1 Tax=Peronospora belbahrii TaxID=622444 RepID=A0AAU9L611_9STRA|nr:unnamed protein product [Peronospora belbahrii]CAH0518699.1 unnamed protein product [Peronospora belbahrii]
MIVHATDDPTDVPVEILESSSSLNLATLPQLTTDMENDKTMHKTHLVECRIEGHEIQKRLSLRKKALDPLRYLPDNGGVESYFTIAVYIKEDENAMEPQRHVVQRSYKQFRSLHLKLMKTYPKSNLPRDFPTMRHNKKLNDEYIEIKCNELTRYLAQLMQIPQIKASKMLHEFLETVTAIEDSSDDECGLIIPSRMLEGLPGTIVTVRAGQSFSVTLPLDTVGDVASWQFMTKKHNIGFSATFEGQMIRAYSREGADMKPVKGFYRSMTPGTCTLTWDNTYTWSKAKVLIYWAEVESQNGPLPLNGQRQVSSASVVAQDKDLPAESIEATRRGSGEASDSMDVDNRRMGFIEHSRSNTMHPRYLMNTSISLLSKPFVHGHVGNQDGSAHGKTRNMIPRTISKLANMNARELQRSNSSRQLEMKAGFLIIQRSVKFRGRNWYRKWFVLDLRKCVLRYYDSEAAARRGLSLAKLNLSNKHASLAVTSSVTLDAAPTPYMFLICTKKHSWNICASSQSECNEWESAISTAILAFQCSQRGRKSKKAVGKTECSTSLRKETSFRESEDDESSRSGACTDTKESAVATSNYQDPDKPLDRIEVFDEDDDGLDNKDGSFDDDNDDESESDSDDELHEDDNDIEVVQPGMKTTLPTNSRTESIGDLPELHNLLVEWKFGFAAVLNLSLLFYLEHSNDNELEASLSTKPKLA